MDELLTVKQVQSLLKVDRITVYRMLKDGRLNGIKIGHEWRFPRREVDCFLSHALNGKPDPSTTPTYGNGSTSAPVAAAADALPLHCVQLIQNVFADVAEVGALCATPDGEPLTEVSNACRFCSLMLESESGRRACMASWRKVAREFAGDAVRENAFATCHAGLQYTHAPIGVNGNAPVAIIIAGQFYTHTPDLAEQEERVAALAELHDIDRRALQEAAEQLPVIDMRKQSKMNSWLGNVALTFAGMGRERAELVGRLRTIAAMSTLGLPERQLEVAER